MWLKWVMRVARGWLLSSSLMIHLYILYISSLTKAFELPLWHSQYNVNIVNIVMARRAVFRLGLHHGWLLLVFGTPSNVSAGWKRFKLYIAASKYRFRLDQAGFDKGSSCRWIVCNADTGVKPTQFTSTTSILSGLPGLLFVWSLLPIPYVNMCLWIWDWRGRRSLAERSC